MSHKVSTAWVGEFDVMVNGVAETGLLNASFTKLLAVDGVDSAVTVTVAEIGSGRYSATFTPNATGLWAVTIRHSTKLPYGVKAAVRVTTRSTDDLAFPTTTGRSLDVDASGGVEVGSHQAGSITSAAFAAGAIDAAALAADAIGASEVSAAAANKVADHVLRRALATARTSSDGDAANFRTLLGAASKLVNKVAVAGGTLTVYQEDDATSYGQQTVTADAAANPITALDTA